MATDFANSFKFLTGFTPLSWQEALYERFISDDIPASCNLPTGLGKTSVLVIWLIALTKRPDLIPRRLVYVVNRRTVVDQTTDEIEKLRVRLKYPDRYPEHADALRVIREDLSKLCSSSCEVPLAISTLRGQFADNREWSADPSGPAIICGTVDMIGSRLLFSGYGVGFKGKPLHAGFLGQDVLLVHDEAHLESAFQTLIEGIAKEQTRCKEFGKFHVMELTATSRGKGETFKLSDEDRKNETVKKRIHAVKKLRFEPFEDGKKLAEKLAAKALEFKDKNRSVLVFARTVKDVEEIAKKLPKERVKTLTGTMRGKERDDLVKEALFKRFLPDGASEDETTIWLVCTSAGEVGVNISADHLVCDLSTFESMAQRFGRVNRFGTRTDTEIHVIHPTDKDFDEKDDYDQRRQKTLHLLRALNGDASPAALEKLDAKNRTAAFAPTPTILPTSEILFDAWALTTIKGKLPGRPEVEPYLHGLPTEWQPPETQVAWREEVEKLNPKYASDKDRDEFQADDRQTLGKLAAELLEGFPLKPHELLRDQMDRVRNSINQLAEKHPDAPAWVMDEHDEVTVTTLRELAATEKRGGKTVYKIDSSYGTVLLPPSVGGLNKQGMLDPKAEADNDITKDVSCECFVDKEKTKPLRARCNVDEPPSGMRLVQRIPLPGGTEESEPEYWYWFVQLKDSEGAKSSIWPVLWEVHVGDVERETAKIVDALPLRADLKNAVKLAAKYHDHGKQRARFQLVLGNTNPSIYWAKSGRKGNRLSETYRHEFGSLLDIEKDLVSLNLGEHQDLVLHLIAAHHGRARPHFPLEEAVDPERSQADAERVASEVPRRFARLQRKYGRWGLAYLESLMRAADWAASANPREYYKEGER
jgi:CRISPR-associated endonuclease/helicase Cas3